MPEIASTPQPNTPEARTPEGTLTDQTSTQTQSASTESLAGKPATEESLAAKPAEAEGAPETYADFTLPEGLELNAESLGKFTEFAKTNNLSQAAAQQLMDFHTAQIAAVTKSPADAVATMRADWRSAVLSDTTLASNGDLRPEVRANISRAIDSLGPELGGKFREAMNLTGVGDHPAFVSAFNAFAKRLSEGKPVTAGSPAQVRNPAKPNGTGANALFPGLPSAQS